jgi:cytochrome c peroxidase
VGEVNGYRLRTSGKVESFHSENGCHACHQIPSAFPERLFFIIPKPAVLVDIVRPLLDSSIGHGEPINARPTFQSPFESVGVALAVPSFFDLGSGTVATGQCESPLTFHFTIAHVSSTAAFKPPTMILVFPFSKVPAV